MTETPTPADLTATATARLNAAAARIRARATAATPGPWRQHDTHLGQYGHTATVLSGEDNDTELRAWLPTMSHQPWDEARNVWADAAWIALMYPGVGEALAQWLEHAAKAHQATLTAAGQTWASVTDPRAVAFVEHMTDRHALAVADAILAGAEGSAV
ncbi:hypothetical protein [Actinacidiphila rubida]|uniref:Uncharacterized protein n=1 Tax=Actinacidiphila rubida TaxID=310780 RepID=A0A1H8SWW2_9ACTN|nr:hypothetical protein [Actinacidiphila rubida]SEO83152.1 hypothetical protein SAMN05216267_104628 [Actinacidiphila rubida]